MNKGESNATPKRAYASFIGVTCNDNLKPQSNQNKQHQSQ